MKKSEKAKTPKETKQRSEFVRKMLVSLSIVRVESASGAITVLQVSQAKSPSESVQSWGAT